MKYQEIDCFVVFPSADIYKPLILSPAYEATAITKLWGLFVELLGGVNIDHQPSIAPTVESLLQPNQIDELPELVGSALDILRPSSYPVAVGLIYIFPEFI
ncbi:MAG: hypothetical protein EZS28_024560 [Streblomastix strix]|uniref:Uncharacterized protein n=1 Tax=Streblomastix strix TaxID=222440 RepID=A0A5J4VC26_9EUKA|nr:MAG: hypothetical protein EZS28_024560 [Streblomastix strix]